MAVTGKVLTICRKTMPSLKQSVMRDFFEILEAHGLYDEKYHNKSDSTYWLNGNLVEFVSMDMPQKKRGTKRNYLWLNEANEFTLEDFRQLAFRTSEFIDLDYNPSDEYHWIYEHILPRPDCTFIKSTYLDNGFLEDSLVGEIEMLRDTDEEYWKIYGLGERGRSKEKIYTNWDIVPGIPTRYIDKVFGLDFGYNHPSVLVCVYVGDGEITIDEIIYETHLTTTQLINRMDEYVDEDERKCFFKCDAAEPDRIEEIYMAGYNAIACKKGKNSVKDGIDVLKRVIIHVTARSVNVIKEIKAYKWKKDKEDHVLDEPVKFKDDAMDATRYAVGLDSEEEKFEDEEIVLPEDIGQEVEPVNIGDY